MQVDIDIETALGVVHDTLVGENSIPVQLRMRQGLDRARYEGLLAALDVLIEHYRTQTTVPKALALAFVDITNYFYFTEEMYTADEAIAIEDAGQRLSQLASQLFSEP